MTDQMACHCCGWTANLGEFYFTRGNSDGSVAEVQCANALACSQRQLRQNHPEIPLSTAQWEALSR